jgi:hypothetical protein
VQVRACSMPYGKHNISSTRECVRLRAREVAHAGQCARAVGSSASA